MNDNSTADAALARGTAGWKTLAALGVSFVVSGDYAGWNYGFAQSGWGGMFVASILMAVMYLCLVFCLAELAAMMPGAGGGLTFVQAAFGPFAGYFTGICVAIEYVAGTALVGTFLGGYLRELTGLGGPMVFLALYAGFIAVHLGGVGEAMKLLLLLAGCAILGLLLFFGVTVTHFSSSMLSVVAPGSPAGILPYGAIGVWNALPFAMALFLAIEGVPLASEEVSDPVRNVPRAMLTAWIILTLLAFGLLVCAPGVAGIGVLAASDSPLVAVLRALPSGSGSYLIEQMVNVTGLVAIAASFFSVFFAYSRQLFALSREGYLPAFLSMTNRRGSPYMAILVPGVVAFLLTVGGTAAPLVIVTMLSAALSYLLMLAAFLQLRRSSKQLERPYRTPGGVVTASIAMSLSIAALIACVALDPKWAGGTLGIMGAFAAYFWLFKRSRRLLTTAVHSDEPQPRETGGCPVR